MSTHTYCKQNRRKSKDRIIVPSDDFTRNIGEIKGGIFYKSNFKYPLHICHKYNAIGLDAGAVHDYIKPYARQIICRDKTRHITYAISVDLFIAEAILDDLGSGPQLFCPIKYLHAEPNTKAQLQLEFDFGGQS